MKIKYVVQVTSSSRDGYGNAYHLLGVTNCQTGESLEIHAHTQNNIEYALREHGKIDGQNYRVFTRELAKREWQRLAKGVPYTADWKSIGLDFPETICL